MNIICKIAKKKKTKGENNASQKLNSKMVLILNTLNIGELSQLNE